MPIRITCDRTGTGTQVIDTETGKHIPNVTRVTIDIQGGRIATAILEIFDVQVDATIDDANTTYTIETLPMLLNKLKRSAAIEDLEPSTELEE